MTIKRLIAASVIGAALAGCVSMNVRLADQTPVTGDMKAQIVKGARDFLRDPYSVRDVEISEAIQHPTGGFLMVCVRGNAKNAMGGYTGRKATMVSFSMDRKLMGAVEDQPFCYDQRIKWHPFPEIYALRNL